jgi:large-conductance mechanosensitive channel
MNIINEIHDFIFQKDIINSCIGFYLATNINSFINSFSKDIIMPILDVKILKINKQKMYIILKNGDYKKEYDTLEEASNDNAVIINYGKFLNSSIDICVSILSLFIVMKLLKKIE